MQIPFDMITGSLIEMCSYVNRSIVSNKQKNIISKQKSVKLIFLMFIDDVILCRNLGMYMRIDTQPNEKRMKKLLS